jgi:hypothetical protein
VVTFNLLNMMDTLDKFVTVTEGDLIVRMDKEGSADHRSVRAVDRASGARLRSRSDISSK